MQGRAWARALWLQGSTKSIAAAQCQFLLPLGERVALSGRSRKTRGSGTQAEAARGYRGRNARAPPLKAGVLLH